MNEQEKFEKFLVLSGLSTDKKQRKIIIQQVLDFCKNSEHQFCRLLQKYQKNADAPGFRPGKISYAKQVQIFSDFENCRVEFLRLVINIWIQANEDKVKQVIELVKSLPDCDAASERVKFDLPTGEKELNDLIDRVSNEACDVSLEDFKIILGYLALVAEDGMKESAEGAMPNLRKEEDNLADFWQTLANKIAELPEEAAEWAQFELFLEEVKVIRNKKSELAAVKRKSVQEKLLKLLGECRNVLDYIGIIEKVSGFKPELCPPGALKKARELLDNMQLSSEQFVALNPNAAKNFKEESELQKRRSELKDELENNAESLSTLAKITKLVDSGENTSKNLKDGRESFQDTPEKTNLSDLVPVTQPGQALEHSVPTDGPADPGATAEVSVEEAPTAASEVKNELSADRKLDVAEIGEKGESLKVSVDETPVGKERWGQGALNELVCRMVKDGDLTGAYWICRSLEYSNEPALFQSKLLAALQGSFWLMPTSDAFVKDMHGLAESFRPKGSPEEELLRLATALNPTFLTQSLIYADWLINPSLVPQANGLIDGLRNFLAAGVVLSPEDFKGIAGEEDRERKIEEGVSEAKNFLMSAPNKRTKFWRANDLWWHLVSPKGELGKLVGIAANNRRDKLEHLKQGLQEWEGADRITKKIRSCEKELGRTKLPEIVGVARQHLFSNIEECIWLCRRYIGAIEQQALLKKKDGGWITKQISNFRNTLDTQLPRVQSRLSELLVHNGDVQAASACLLRSLYHFQSYFEIHAIRLRDDFAEPQDWQWLRRGTSSLSQALGNRLLWVSNVQLDEDRQPIPTHMARVAYEIASSTHKDTGRDEKLQGWLKKRDFRFKESFLQSIDCHNDHSILRVIDAEMAKCREDFKCLSMEAADEIEQAVVDGIIAEERSQLTGELLGVDIKKTENLHAGFEKITELKLKIAAARSIRLVELQQRWDTLWPRISASKMNLDKKNSIKLFVTKRIESGDTRVVEESLSHLDDYLDQGVEPEEAWFQGKPAQDTLGEFLGRLDRLNKWSAENRDFRKVVADLERQQQILDIDFSEAIRKRRHQIAEIFTTWGELKNEKPKAVMEVRKRVLKLLRFLGFLINPEREGWGVKDKAESNWWHGLVEMSAGDLARPFPQFGSQAFGSYDVVCFWGQPDPNIIASNLSVLGLENKCVIAIFFGSLSAAQRSNIVRMSHLRKLSMAVLDEALLVHIARDQETRLSGLLRCSLPFSAVNPYEPFKAGDVPPEMFFGRKEMARQLEEPGESCFVYGGRQLGKSALLRHVERNFHNPAREQYARVEDIKLIGAPWADQFTSTLFERLRDAFKEFKLLGERVSTARPEEIIKHLRSAMLDKPKRRVLILLDEADNFLESDAKDNFRMVDQLRILMAETSRRFKVVFTGLHSVQRYQGIPNQPLAHFGRPICVGPLEPKAARQLVLEPISALGFHLDDATTLRILSYTNYHPGLIQLFCHKLLTLLQAKYKDGLPPYTVSREIVESVYRNDEVYNSIRDRFDWTLALDPRYQAVAWSLIVEQMDDRDSYSQTFSIVEILNLVHCHWKKGFIDTDITALGGLLDEMVGLGVLVRDRQNKYRLRSPNLVRIMGTQEDVLARLDELSKKEPLAASAVDYYHMPLDSKATKFSPFTHAQQRILNQNFSGIGVVLASEALGLNELEDTFRRFLISGNDAPSEPYNLTQKVGSAEELRATLHDLWQKKKTETKTLVTFGPKVLPGPDLLRLFEEALSFTESRKSTNRWVRVIFIMNPNCAVEWFRLDRTKREEIEQAAGGMVHPQKFDLLEIRQRLALSMPEKVHNESACEKVKLATGGWPYLIEQFLKMCLKETDPQPVTKEFSSKLLQPKSELAAGFTKALGLGAHADEWAVMKALVGLGDEEVPVDFLQDYINSESPELSERCTDLIEHLRRIGLVDLHVDTVKVDPILKAVYTQHGI